MINDKPTILSHSVLICCVIFFMDLSFVIYHFNNTDHDTIGVHMLLEVVDGGLLEVAEVADAECPFGGGLPFEVDLLTEVGRRDEGGWYDVMVVVATIEDLVVRLSVIWTEHHAHQGEVGLVADKTRFLEEREGIADDGGWHHVQTGPCLGRVIRGGGVVEISQTEVRSTSTLQHQSAIE